MHIGPIKLLKVPSITQWPARVQIRRDEFFGGLGVLDDFPDLAADEFARFFVCGGVGDEVRERPEPSEDRK
jgi:hypothetical protein